MKERATPLSFSCFLRDELIAAIRANQSAFGIELVSEAIERLADYYEIVQESNSLLHLVAPSSPENFAVRHILESLTLLEFLPANASFADVGTGAGLPSIPCLIVRNDLSALLIESKEKKAMFLRLAIGKLGLQKRGIVVNRQFEEVKDRHHPFVTCRALDKFIEKLPRLLKWTGERTFLFYGGPSLAGALSKNGAAFDSKLMPMSERRYLFIGKGLHPSS